MTEDPTLPGSSGPEDPTLPAPDPVEAGTIGPYRILQRIGEDGMGEVYIAEQTSPIKRRVALKVIKRGMDSRQILARFQAERQALALMNRRCIAKVYDAGETSGGRPYIAMEHVKGVPLTAYCDQHKLELNDRLELFIQVCEGVQHAHQKAVIHRDLKPSNVLVTEEDGKPVPKIIDFGPAKAMPQRLSDLTMFTQVGNIVGTLEYMSPEQATRLTTLDAGTGTTVLEARRSDIAHIHVRAGNYDLARATAVEALEINRRLYGGEHQEIAHNLHVLGDILLEQGDLAGAEELLVEALDINLRILGADHPENCELYNHLGLVYARTATVDRAEAMAAGSRAILAKPEHRNDSMLGMLNETEGEIALARGDVDAACEAYRRGRDLRLQAHGQFDMRTLKAQVRLAALTDLRGDRDEAVDLLEQAVANGYWKKSHLETDDGFAGLRTDPRFHAILASVEANRPIL